MHRLPDFTLIQSRLLAAALAILLVQAAPELALASSVPKPLASNVTEVCDGADCTMQVSFSTASVTWRVPSAAGNLRIELAGASGGGERGGSGALIRASLSIAPGDSLELRLGGVGRRGNDAPGGYNGGGNAGSGMGQAGSGGGMSQVFLGSEASEPILVAGGGGGAGGGAGVSGGAAGLLGVSGSNGKNSTGGGGGQSNRGGTGGESGGVQAEATSGEAGLGGTGASLQLGSAGGGGGGGYFGGGGGGSSYEGCCHPASGGGGGSSFLDVRYVSNPEFSFAPQGSGFAIIRYQLLPSVISHSWQQLDARSGELRLNLSQPISKIHSAKVTISGCTLLAATPLNSTPAKSWKLSLSDCLSQAPKVRIAPGALESAGSASGPIFGPAVEYDLQMQLNIAPAKLKLLSPGISTNSTVKVLLSSDSKISGLNSSDISAAGCDSIAVRSNSTGYEVALHGCRDGRHALRLAAGSVVDAQGIASPPADMSLVFWVDLLAPRASLTLLEMDQDARLARVELSLSETVSDPLRQLESQLTDLGCQSNWKTSSATKYSGAVSCDVPVTLSIAANSLTDRVGRSGPESMITVRLDFRPLTQGAAEDSFAIPPWIAVGAPPSSEPERIESPIEESNSAAGPAKQQAWFGFDQASLRILGIGILVLLAAALVVAALRAAIAKKRVAKSHSAEDDGSLAVNKYPVFGKPAHRLG